jgi:putative redox protein
MTLVPGSSDGSLCAEQTQLRHHALMGGYEASVTTIDDGTREEGGPLVVAFRDVRSGKRNEFAIDAFTGGHLLHLAVAGCVYNDLFREAAAGGIALTRVQVSADGGFAGEPCASTGISYQVHVEGDASAADLDQLVAHVERIAEVPSVVRIGGEVRLSGHRVVPRG